MTIYRDHELVVNQGPDAAWPDHVIWIDLLNPTEDERRFVEKRTKVTLPSKESLSEIEVSSRLTVEHDTLYLSTPVVASGESRDPELSPAGFILSAKLLITIRYTQLPSFDRVAEYVKADPDLSCSIEVFTALLEAVVYRGADVLERLGGEIDKLSRSVFRTNPSLKSHVTRSTDNLRRTLTKVGAVGDRVSQARDVLLGVERIAIFAGDAGHDWISREYCERLHAVSKDVRSLEDYETHLSGKTQFLLDAILGYISIEQNEVFKVLTIASVIGIPPTILAGIWGMNFHNMPELNVPFGYGIALVIIILSAILPLAWFKSRGWF